MVRAKTRRILPLEAGRKEKKAAGAGPRKKDGFYVKFATATHQANRTSCNPPVTEVCELQKKSASSRTYTTPKADETNRLLNGGSRSPKVCPHPQRHQAPMRWPGSSEGLPNISRIGSQTAPPGSVPADTLFPSHPGCGECQSRPVECKVSLCRGAAGYLIHLANSDKLTFGGLLRYPGAAPCL